MASVVLINSGCTNSNFEMKEAKIIEMVYWSPKEEVSVEEMKSQITKLNEFVSKQKGFVSRKTAMADDHTFLDIVYWKSLADAKAASDQAMKEADLMKVFDLIDEETMLFKHFETFNALDK